MDRAPGTLTPQLVCVLLAPPLLTSVTPQRGGRTEDREVQLDGPSPQKKGAEVQVKGFLSQAPTPGSWVLWERKRAEDQRGTIAGNTTLLPDLPKQSPTRRPSSPGPDL